jgi:hypothetical protein
MICLPNTACGATGATAPSYRCADPQAMLVPVAESIAPVSKLREGALRRFLRGVPRASLAALRFTVKLVCRAAV